VLSQKIDGFWHPIAFLSKTMNPAERNYDIHDKEMLAIVRDLQVWRAELQGLQQSTPFLVLTDHRALEYFTTAKKLNARQARRQELLAGYDYLIKYRPGRKNLLADALTRKDQQPDTSRD
jgi:hypothetical protein